MCGGTGRVRQSVGASTSRSVIREMGHGDSYKYLGVQQVFGPCSGETKTAMDPEYLRRVQIVWSSSLSAAFRAHNTWVAAVLRYYVAPVEWGVRELSQVDVRTRAVLVRCGANVPTASKDRLYLARDESGRGLTNVQLMAEREVGGGGKPYI